MIYRTIFIKLFKSWVEYIKNVFYLPFIEKPLDFYNGKEGVAKFLRFFSQ